MSDSAPESGREAVRLTKSHLRELTALSKRKYREQTGRYLIEGVRLINSALQAGAHLTQLIVERGFSLDQLETSVPPGLPVYEAAAGDFGKISAVETSQGIIGMADMPENSRDPIRDSHRVLLLDSLQDPGNVGTLIRTAAWFGVEAVIASFGTVDCYNPKVVRASMGGLWSTHVYRGKSAAEEIRLLREEGYVIVGAHASGSDVRLWQPSSRTVLVMGSEAHGLDSAVENLLDSQISVPRIAAAEAVESLNVTVAASILMYCWTQGVPRRTSSGL